MNTELIRGNQKRSIDEIISSSAIGPGWQPMVKRFLQEVNPDAQVVQIKEKFGGLRLYIDKLTPEESKTAEQLEKKSYTICEDCGNPGRETMRLGWISTLCEDCEDKSKQPKEDKSKSD